MSDLNIIILVAGKSSRLDHIANDIPKCLVNIGNTTALGQQIEYWNQYNPTNIFVVVHSKYKQLTNGYLTANDYSNITVLTEDNQNGSADAINNVIMDNPHLIDSNVVLNWGDIIPKSKISLSSDSSIIYTHGTNCRYHATNNALKKVNSGGNVIGIYFIHKFQPFTYNLDEMEDYVNVIGKSQFSSSEMEHLVDFGDIPKFNNACSGLQISREFNEIIISDTEVTKIAINPKGQKLQVDELEWYSYINSDNIPKIISKTENAFSMTKLDGCPVFESKNDKLELIKNSIQSVKQIHSSRDMINVDNDTLTEDIQIECIDKLIHRCKVIENMIHGFPKVTSVNGRPIHNHLDIANILFDKIINLNTNTTMYSFIHGDCNFSNTFDTKDGIKFIDPRGYFGNSKIFGLPSYDFSKILYACSGYDSFNAALSFSIPENIDGNIDLKIEPFIDEFLQLDHLFSEECYYWLPLIWINLGGYFKNNPVKAVCAYYYGLYLAEIILEKYGSKIRTLTNGSMVNELDSGITAKIITKCPKKWILHDTETNVKYQATGNPTLCNMWKKINE